MGPTSPRVFAILAISGAAFVLLSILGLWVEVVLPQEVNGVRELVSIENALQLGPWMSARPPTFSWWQVLTFPLAWSLRPLAFLFYMFMLWWACGAVERDLGTTQFLRVFGWSLLGTLVVGLPASMIDGFDAPYGGLSAQATAIILVYCFRNPNATIFLIAFPIRAIWIAWFDIAFVGLTTLTRSNPFGFYWIGAMGFAYLAAFGYLDRFYPEALEHSIRRWGYQRKMRRMTVLEGGRDSEDSDDDEGPVYH